MSPIHSSKRRRLETAANTLSQPFKSPFKTPSKPSTSTHPTNDATPSTFPTKPSPNAANRPPLTPSPAPQQPTITTPLRSHPQHKTTPTPASASPTTLQKLQKRHTHLLSTLATSKSALETSSQALKIESSARDKELEQLITKWKGASRAAAEEVFRGVRDRVNKMGGVRAMREREKVGTQRWGWGWDEGNKEDGAGDGSQGEKGKESGEDGEDGAGFRANIRDEVGEEVDEREEGAPKQSDEIGDEEGYTMDLMLRSLNIDLDVIGYERKLQRWVD